MLVMSFEAFVADFHAHFTRDANARLFKGIDRELGELPDPSIADALAGAEEAQRLIARIEPLRESLEAAGALDFDRDLDLDLARWALESDVELRTRAFNDTHRLAQLPNAGNVIGDGIFLMLVNDPREPAARLEDMTRRIEAVPDFVRALFARLERPVRVWVDMDVQRVEGLGQLFGTVRAFATHEVPGADLARLDRAIAEAEQALATYARDLRALPTTDDLHVGTEQTLRIVRARGIDLSLDALHGIARDFLARTGATIEALRQKLAAKYDLDPNIETAHLHRWLKERFAVRLSADDAPLDEVLDVYQRAHERIMAFIGERSLFPIFDGQDIKILRTPGFMEPSVPAGAMLPPPAFREGVRTSLVYLTLHRDQLDDHTELDIPLMMIHEGIPGHHLQLATGSIHPSTIRRHLEPMEQAEGWTTMLEDYMLEQGFMGELTDETRFCTQRDLSRIGARVAIDLFFMSGERRFLDLGIAVEGLDHPDPFEAAIALLRAVTGFSRGRAEAEVRWYSIERGYPLCYLTGNHLVWKLKHEVIEAQRGKLEGLELDRRFHATYLHAGNMPLSFLRRVFRHEGLLPAAD